MTSISTSLGWITIPSLGLALILSTSTVALNPASSDHVHIANGPSLAEFSDYQPPEDLGLPGRREPGGTRCE